MKKTSKFVLLTTLCCLSLSFMTPNFTLVADAATGTGEETVQPRADIIEWVYEIRGNKVYKRLYNTSTGEWIGDWIYVRDL